MKTLEFKNVKEFKNYFINAFENGEIKTINFNLFNQFYLQHSQHNKQITSDQIKEFTTKSICIKLKQEDLYFYKYYKLPFKCVLKINNNLIKILK